MSVSNGIIDLRAGSVELVQPRCRARQHLRIGHGRIGLLLLPGHTLADGRRLAGRHRAGIDVLWRLPPQLIVPDNPRALVTVAQRYEAKLTDTLLDFASHCGCLVLPAPVCAGRDHGAYRRFGTSDGAF